MPKCKQCQKEFEVREEDRAFYQRIDVPAPTWCPECRRQRRLSWRNDFVFYNRTCDSCKRNIISIYSPDKPQVIYCNTCWWGDSWDPKSYAREFDFSRPFFEQFAELRQSVPALALVNDNGIGSTNCEYVQNVQYSKNCYMAMVSWKLENCMYFCYGADAKDAVDSMGIFSTSEGIYEALYSGKCYGSRHITNCESLIDCAYCYDCHNCEKCFQCTGLRSKKYCFRNKQYKKEEYEKILAEFALDTWSGSQRAQAEFEDFMRPQPRKFSWLLNCDDCTGNNLANSKNAHHIFHVRKAEDCKFLENGDTEKDSYDLCVGGELESCYEGLTPDHSYRALFTSYVWKSTDVLYSDFCQACTDCFGCVGLRLAQNSILNKSYSTAEYAVLKEKIINHMKETGEYGEFFPMRYSPFAYNESVAQLSFPMAKDAALKRGLQWQDQIQFTMGKTTLREIPDNIRDVPNSITNEVLECENCKRNYKVVPDELAFYRKWKIPVPRFCFHCRLARRFAVRGPSHLWHRQCTCELKNHQWHTGSTCPHEFETTYAPDRPEKVFCEECYQAEVV